MSRVRVSLAAPIILIKFKTVIKVGANTYYKKNFPYNARVVELVDTRDLKSLAEKRAGSSPAPGTIW